MNESTRRSAASWARQLWGPSVLVAGAAAALWIDRSVAEWCMRGACPQAVKGLLDLTEVFGHGLGVLLVALAVFQLDPAHRRALPHLLAASFGAGLAANLVKLLIVRVRPLHWDFQGGVWDTFGDWLPFTSGGGGNQSFLSGHTATAVGLAVALARLYPRGRWLFPALALLVACQRVASGAHYPSDVLAAAAIGSLVARAVMKGYDASSSSYVTAKANR